MDYSGAALGVQGLTHNRRWAAHQQGRFSAVQQPARLQLADRIAALAALKLGQTDAGFARNRDRFEDVHSLRSIGASRSTRSVLEVTIDFVVLEPQRRFYRRRLAHPQHPRRAAR